MPYCPKPSPSELLHSVLPPGTFGFFAACRSGTLKEISCTRSDLCISGCAIDKAFMPFQIKWAEIVAGGRTAPGGNRYWSTTIPADPNDPRVFTALNTLASRSATAFVDIWGKVTGKDMAYVMAAGQWVTKAGIMNVPVLPIPTETPAAFVARGGWLLDMRPAFSPILNGTKWQGQGTSFYPWMKGVVDKDIQTVELWGNYDAAVNKLNYMYRIVYKGSWQRTVDNMSTAIANAGTTFCSKLAQNAGYAMTAASVIPALAPYAAVYTSALGLCGIVAPPPLPCVPREPQPGDGMVLTTMTRVVLTPAAGTPPSGSGSGGKQGVLVLPSIMDQGSLTVAQNSTGVVYPTGTIAWENIKGAGYDIAVPQQGASTTHRIVRRGAPTAPANARIVDQAEWEKAVFPWLRRANIQLGLGVATAALVTTAAIVTLRIRSKQ